ncbi:hypothetical protein C8Q70DRAFT_1024732 [Cubamyces menziesii]|uniref:AN1-type domain-containing protein n=1 Tax=Trametes cubensis TaxID=1111947 RepID=A0AAD7TEJ1_9APHY|nr:hypothetical protein C8Q70DRAFT_1024732 [Cubamyces menziesii]KAJ8454121.1 hypothetical protein ONZ51_g13210 [Trametes cubensis]
MPQAHANAEIGAHCALPSCNLNDFLPIRCKCDQLFCRDHVFPDAHSCPLLAQTQTTSEPYIKLQRCAAPSCNKPSLEAYVANAEDTLDRSPALCPGCKQAYCAQHREPKSHSCSPPEPSEPAPQKNAAAKALLAKHFGASSDSGSGSSNTRPSNPKKLAQQRQIAVMKMRHKAKPLDPKDSTGSVPMDQRLHVFVRQEGQDKASERVFWLRKTTWTGRALDMLASQFKLVISDTQPLKLLYINDEGTMIALRTDQPLADQIPDGAALSLSREFPV